MTAEQKEKQYLKDLLHKIDIRLGEINEAVQLKKDEIDYLNNHMQEYKRDMDHLEKNAMRESIHNFMLQGEHALDSRKRLHQLKDTAYFGRIDFKQHDTQKTAHIYVGVHNFQFGKPPQNLVFDWRAPISSLFYDYETGEAAYETKEKTVKGNIELKRQFRIRKGEMEYMLDTDVTILDEVLQKELNRASSAKMKNIVATIQKEQNEIIRNEHARHLIIQGVAGSGKTSIALHRIAFLLYRFKGSISSKDILIISPNKVFAGYISNVLPELGEETVDEISMEEIAHELFEHRVKFQSFFEQVSELLEKNDPKLIERISFKSSPEFLQKTDEYLTHLENTGFKPENIMVKGKPVPDWFIQESFEKYARLPLLKRFNEVVNDIVNNVFRYYKVEVQYKDRTELHKTIRNMFPSYNVKVLYKGFYEWLGKPELLKMKARSTYEWADVYALLYFKMRIEGLPPYSKIKHVVIDEMQDYSVVQYRVLSRLFPCKKTILGDINQSVNPFSSSNLAVIQGVFGDAESITMLKSYRSTYEITEFTKTLGKSVAVDAVERHGDEPEIVTAQNDRDEAAVIEKRIAVFEKSTYNSLGIICKTQKQADQLYKRLHAPADMKLLNKSSAAFGSGIVITTAHLSKGLEFDAVIVPGCSLKNYANAADRQMLYVACTRAMHQLTLTFTGKPSAFLSGYNGKKSIRN